MRKFLTAIFVATLVALGSWSLRAQAAATTTVDCSSDYSIMPGGASSAANFITKAKANSCGDMPAIYSNFGLAPSDYSRFASSAKAGTLYNDGHIVVDGVTVGRSTLNLGRVKDANFNQKVVINGQKYWGGSFGSTFHANTAAVTVLFNDQGVMQFAVINSCGNPQRITATAPVTSCDRLHKTKVAGTNNRYSFTTDVTATQGAVVTKAVYDFGDGASKTVSDVSQPVEHSFTKDSTVKVTVTFSLPGGGSVTKTSVNCAIQVNFSKPPVKTPPTPPTPPAPTPTPPQNASAYCTGLQADLIDTDTRTYRFTATAFTAGGATLTGADFSFDNDGQMPASPDGNLVIVQHSFSQDNDGHTITATLHFTGADGQAINGDCATSIPPVSQPTVVTAVAASTTTPSTCVSQGKGDDCSLTDTGAGTMALTIFGGAGALATASHYLIRRRLLGL